MKFSSLCCLLVLTLVLWTCSDTFCDEGPQTNSINFSYDRIQFTKEEKNWLDQNHVVRARVGINPPLHFFDGKNKGISVDYFNLIAKIIGFQVEYVNGIPWHDALDKIKGQETIDLLLTAKNVKERQRFIGFSDDYLLMPWVIFSRTNSDFIGSIDDLAGRIVAVEKSFVMQKKLMTEFPSIKLLEKNHSVAALEAVACGEADAYIGNLATSTYIINKHNLSSLKVACPVAFGNHNQAFAVRKDWPELVSLLNKAIKAIPPRELSRLRNKWFNVKFDYGISKTVFFKWLFIVFVVSTMFSLFFVYKNRRLRVEVEKRKKAEEKFKKQRDLFELVVNSVPTRIFWKDLNLVYLGCNIHFAKDSGMKSPEDVIGKDDYSLVWKKDADKDRADDQSVISTGEPKLNYEEGFLNIDGEKIWWMTNKMPLRNHDDKIIGIIATSQDITEKKKAEKALYDSEVKHRTYVENSPLGIFVFDGEGKYVDINLGACELLGYTHNELIQLSIQDVSTPEVGTRKFQQLKEEGVISYEGGLTRKDGSIIDVGFDAVALPNDQFIAFCSDISERKQAEEEKRKLETQLRQSQKMESIGTLAGGIAHDFNNILYPLIGFTEMLQEDLPEDSPEQESVTEIFHAALRAKDLVKQILALSRQSDDQTFKPVRLQSILNEALKLLKSSIPTTIDIQGIINPDCGMVVADPTQMHQIIMNLATNAYHAMHESGGQLNISLDQVEIDFKPSGFSKLLIGNYALLKVIDTGAGIKKEVVGKIFDPYFTTKEIGKGTGLGLSVVQGIVKNCHGDIQVYSEPGKGTEIHVYLPIMNKITKIDEFDPTEPIQGGKETILLVDDEEMIVKMEKKMLERLGYNVITGVGSVEALDLFKKNPEIFDLIISDMTMPEMTGLELAGKIKAIRFDIPIVICTGFSDHIDEKSFKKLGLQGYVTKPVIKREIAKTIRDVLPENHETGK